MKNIPDTARPLNYESAKRLLDSTSDPILANVLQYALAQLQLQLLPTAGDDQERWERELPLAPVDVAFFLRVIKSMFEHRALLDGLLAGKTTAQAAGWDIFE